MNQLGKYRSHRFDYLVIVMQIWFSLYVESLLSILPYWFQENMKKEKECGSDRNDQTNFDISGNMIEETRRIIAEMNETQRF